MRVLICAEDFYPTTGGIQTSSSLIGIYLSNKNVEVTVITKTPSSDGHPFPFFVERNPSKKKLKSIINNVDVILMNGFDFYVFFYAKLRRKIISVTYRDLTMICPKGTKWRIDGPCLIRASPGPCFRCLKESNEPKIVTRLLRPLIKSILSLFVDANICTSLFGYERYKLWRKRLIFNAIDASKFCPSPSKGVNSIPQLLFIGRLIPEKGCQTLLESLKILKDKGISFRLSICGEGPFEPTLKKLMEKYDLTSEVKMCGNQTGKKLIDIIQKTDISIVPSLIDEPFGLTSIEAMSCGVPVIAANVGGLGRIVEEAGYVFERGDANGLATHIERLTRDSKLRAKVGARSRELVLRKYDWKQLGKNYLDLFTELINRNKRRLI